MVNAQNWLKEIPNKSKIKAIGRKCSLVGIKDEEFRKLEDNEVLEGELKIDDFPNLEEINLAEKVGNKGLLTKVIIIKCPNLKTVNLFSNAIDELELSDLVKLDNLTVSNNNLGKIKVNSGCKSLRSIITFNREIPGGEGTKEKWEGLEYLENLRHINSDGPIIPVQDLKNWKVIISPRGLDGILKADGTVDEEQLKEYKEAKKRPTQEQLNKAVADERKKFENHVDPKNLKDAATKAGFGFTQEDINNAAKGQLGALVAANQKIQDYEKELKAALGLPSTASLPSNWKEKIVSKDRYSKLEKEKEVLEKRQKIFLEHLTDSLTKERYKEFTEALPK